MASLVSPGVSVSIIDESVYAPTAVATVPLVFVATAQDKLNASGTATASGTTAANANKLFQITSQRDLTSTFGTPTFYKDSNGTPLHGYEVNEYGLFAAYSALGVSNRVFVVRADVDTAQLIGTSNRPTGPADNGTIWLDLAGTNWGIQEWDADTKTFTNVAPIVITKTSDLTGGVPKSSIGQIGDYAVVTTNTNNPIYYKKYTNAWVYVGTSGWHTSHPAVQGTATDPLLTSGDTFLINGTEITLTGTDVDNAVSRINAALITGVSAYNNSGRLEIFADTTASSDGSTVDGAIYIAAGGIGSFLSNIGIDAGQYYGPGFQHTPHYTVPEWKSSDAVPRPSGSVWLKTTSANSGADFVVKVYNSLTGQWTTTAAPVYDTDWEANAVLDPAGGGANIAEGSFHVNVDIANNSIANYTLFRRAVKGATVLTGTVTNPTFNAGNQFEITVSQVGTSTLSSVYTVTLSGTSAASFVSDVLAKNVPNLNCELNSAGKIVFTHTKGGIVRLVNVSPNSPVTTAGFTSSTLYCRAITGGVIGSNWVANFVYTASMDEPTTDPVDGTYWYDSTASEVDLMIHDGNDWVGYQTNSNDARGYDLSLCDPEGPIVSASEPMEQSDGTALSYGDIWIDTSDLENYPLIKRYDNVSGQGKWQLIDNTDGTTENGILFADARWDTDGTSDPITDDKPAITDLLMSSYLDPDAPDAALYPKGMLLWNTRRSGYNVKMFMSDAWNANDYPDVDPLPAVSATWRNASGNRNDGSPYMGRHAPRVIISSAIASAIDTNTEVREEQRQFNLIATPGYPEVAANMVALNNDRRNTAFIVADTPYRLAPTGTAILNWADGNANDSITTADPYMAVFYPSGITNNPFTTGNAEVMVPASHMALRTLIRNDDVAFPWFAPAGLRRGLIDNATRVGYLDANGELVSIGLTESLRDTLYENKINPITLFPGVGLVNFGQKTLNPYASALDRINVARLVCYIRERLQLIVRPFLFEPNDKITRDEAKQVVESLMNDLVAKRGLYDYLVVCDDTNNTPSRIDANELYIDVAIEPVKAVEFIYIPVRIKNTGEIAAG
jgi:hypothetical protein